jgi:hypothetical protein
MNKNQLQGDVVKWNVASRSSLKTVDGIPLKEPHLSLYYNVVTTADKALQDKLHSSLDPTLVYTKLQFILNFSRHL